MHRHSVVCKGEHDAGTVIESQTGRLCGLLQYNTTMSLGEEAHKEFLQDLRPSAAVSPWDLVVLKERINADTKCTNSVHCRPDS